MSNLKPGVPTRTRVLLTILLYGGVPALHSQGPPLRVALDSGTVARLSWRGDGRQQVQLVRRLTPTSDSLHFCIYPSSRCGPGSVNPVRARPVTALDRVEIRHGNHALRGAVWGVGIGTLFGAFSMAVQKGLSDTRVTPGRQLLAFTLPFTFSVGLGALIGSGGHDWGPAAGAAPSP